MMSSETLKQLMPLDLGPDADIHLQVIGEQIDKFLRRVEDFKREMFIATAEVLVGEWEKDYGVDNSAKQLQERRDILAAMRKSRGGISKQHFIDLAAARGYPITIRELGPPRAGIAKVGAKVYGEEMKFVWEVTLDPLLGNQGLETILEKLKPAWTYIKWTYAASGEYLFDERTGEILTDERTGEFVKDERQGA